MDSDFSSWRNDLKQGVEIRPIKLTMDDGSLLIAVDLRKEKQLIIAGKTIAIESADASRLVYMIQ